MQKFLYASNNRNPIIWLHRGVAIFSKLDHYFHISGIINIEIIKTWHPCALGDMARHGSIESHTSWPGHVNIQWKSTRALCGHLKRDTPKKGIRVSCHFGGTCKERSVCLEKGCRLSHRGHGDLLLSTFYFFSRKKKCSFSWVAEQ